MALASVLLPVPFGPMMACTSPCLTVRLRPLTMAFSPMLMCRSLITSWDMGLIGAVRVVGGAAAEGELDRVRVEARGQQPAQLLQRVGGQGDVVHLAGGVLVGTRVFPQVRGAARPRAIDVPLAAH